MNFQNLICVGTVKQTIERYLFLAPISRRARLFVFILFGVDAFFIGMHVFYLLLRYFGYTSRTSEFADAFKLSRDGSLPEIFNYLQLCLISAVLLWIYRHSRIPIYLILAALFFYAFLDDSLTFHEHSRDLIEALGFSDMWRRNVNAQALYFVIVGGVSFLLLLAGWINANWTHRRLSAPMIILFCTLGFFAGFIDFLHDLISIEWHHTPLGQIVYSTIDIIEDGAEMLIVTLSCWVAFSIRSYIINYSNSQSVWSGMR